MRHGVKMRATASLLGIYALLNLLHTGSADDDKDDPRKPRDYNELKSPDIVGEKHDCSIV